MTTMIKTGDRMGDFDVTTIDGARVSYSTLWQRKNLLLVTLPPDSSSTADEYVAALRARWNDLTAHDTAYVVTRDHIEGIPAPAVLIADRWGEVQFVTSDPVARLPDTGQLVEWLRYVQMKCPECEGEVR